MDIIDNSFINKLHSSAMKKLDRNLLFYNLDLILIYLLRILSIAPKIFSQSFLKYTFSERLINVGFESVVCFYKTWLEFGSELDLSKMTGIFSEVYFPMPYITRV